MPSKKFFFMLTILMFLNMLSHAQDYTWWNEKHDWDGVTPWYNLINTSPGFMGPNALPIPNIKNGRIPEDAYFKFSLDKYVSTGDKTENLNTELHLPLFSKRVGLNIRLVPFEHYKMDTPTRDVRIARNITGEGYAVGDLYLGTYIQLIENKKNLPDVLLTINLKTASGSKLSDARFTDAPGYFFDLSFGKSFSLNKHKTIWARPFTLLGFYVWQLQGHPQQQNDALLYGLGFQLDCPKLEIKSSVGGYYGYLNNGDRPMVCRLAFKSKFNSMLNYELSLQQGLHDFDYALARLSCYANLANIRKNEKNKSN